MKKMCFKCKCEKLLISFYKHKQMKDGHLNKCSECVVKDVSAWRDKNPDCRAKEARTRQQKLGYMSREEYFTKRKTNAKGRKVSSLQYAHKRRLQQERHTVTELDELAFIEACDVRNRRKALTGFDWHIDHIVPINHKSACGLHNAFNLQVVPASWNIKKKHTNMDKFWNSGY
jgi:hypothetical protein